jgi:environmental stress-induced protein Ves
VNAERITLGELVPQAWKNGAGLTRELAVSPLEASSEHFDWRISVAEVTRDAPFSAFPGVDRCIVLLRGAGMRLRAASGAWVQQLVEPLEPFRFSGDDAVDATLIAGESSDLNVMVRRGRYRCDVNAMRETSTTAAADAGLLLCCEGEWRINAATPPLMPMQALLWRSSMPPLQLTPARAGSSLVVVQLHTLCQDGAE